MPDPGSGCGQNSGPEQGRFKNIVSVALVISHRADFRFPNYSLSNKGSKKAWMLRREFAQLLYWSLLIIK